MLALTGPVTIPGYNVTLTKDNAVLKLEEIVEKAYLLNEDLDTQNRKAIMKSLTPALIEKLFSLGNVTKLADFAHEQISKKNIMINFTDSQLQSLIEDVHWDGSVAQDWDGDYLMAVITSYSIHYTKLYDGALWIGGIESYFFAQWIQA